MTNSKTPNTNNLIQKVELLENLVEELKSQVIKFDTSRMQERSKVRILSQDIARLKNRSFRSLMVGVLTGGAIGLVSGLLPFATNLMDYTVLQGTVATLTVQVKNQLSDFAERQAEFAELMPSVKTANDQIKQLRKDVDSFDQKRSELNKALVLLKSEMKPYQDFKSATTTLEDGTLVAKSFEIRSNGTTRLKIHDNGKIHLIGEKTGIETVAIYTDEEADVGRIQLVRVGATGKDRLHLIGSAEPELGDAKRLLDKEWKTKVSK